jgi:ubiquinone/menaquinone biosynthesis C-methylase UbiE
MRQPQNSQPQNIYDNPEFFAGYQDLRRRAHKFHDLVIQPTLRGMMPPLEGKRVLDLGCGAGDLTRWLADHGALTVTGVDVSERMLEVARREVARPSVTFIRSSAEDAEFPTASFDLIVSSLMFHYVADLRTLFAKLRDWTQRGGALVFVMEHPIFTSSQGREGGQWVRDDTGRSVAWIVDNYAEEGRRVSRWLVDDVVRYHHTFASIVNGLIDAGFRITRVDEPWRPERAEVDDLDVTEERIRPLGLYLAAEAS